MDEEELKHIIAEATAKAYAQGYLEGFLDCLEARAKLLATPNLLAMPVGKQVQQRKGGSMTKEQKQFITKKLIPFILRAQGRGFAMSRWIWKGTGEIHLDGLARRIPLCGTVCCIGGSVNLLAHHKYASWTGAGYFLGLSVRQANTLFFGWERSASGIWPKEYKRRYYRAKTTMGKAKVAASLLRQVVKTDGKILGQ